MRGEVTVATTRAVVEQWSLLRVLAGAHRTHVREVADEVG
jgi:myo-inositol catabolism protein IolC